ncbi:MAG TPA: aldose epimerase family protein [Phycisphaerales bacterium]|nr:aldose epimerase family protein [Phycisphaerales bacterium]
MLSDTDYGEADGRRVRLYTLTNAAGMRAGITNFGATVTELWAPDRDGRHADVVLGYDTLDEYRRGECYFGCMVGRCANRIARGRFDLDGERFTLAANNGPNHLHGGVRGFSKVVWDAEPLRLGDGDSVRMTYRSRAGEEGYPGTVEVSVQFALTEAGELRIEIEAETDAPTVVNIAHHGYWNLGGHESGTIREHELTLHADRYTPVDATFIPTGELAPVEGTPFDFREPTPIGRRLDALARVGPTDPGGYDVNYVLNGEPRRLRAAARVRDARSGRVMEIRTDQPGVQLYSGNYLAGEPGKGGARYPKHAGLCLETQHFPDAVNRRALPGWPDPVLRPGQRYRHTMVHAFSAR